MDPNLYLLKGPGYFKDSEMNRAIIITDLTRFRDQTKVCVAGIDPRTGDCIRLQPYPKAQWCEKHKIFPGTIVKGDFKVCPERLGPHQEDYWCRNLSVTGCCSYAEFKDLLVSSQFASVGEGFEFSFEQDQKHLPIGHSVDRSIVTIPVNPTYVEIVRNTFKPGKIKLHFTDQADHRFRYISVTDLGFYDYAMQHQAENDLEILNTGIHAQNEVFLRLGLSRRYQANDTEGYWLQVNGIYTFPDVLQPIRSYH